MQYARLVALIKESSNSVTMPRDLFLHVLEAALRAKGVFDEDFYLQNNQDVKDAIDIGSVQSAADHYYIAGYLENRLPARVLVDENYYLESNPDILKAIRAGEVPSAQEHFETNGLKEGRLPSSGFTLF